MSQTCFDLGIPEDLHQQGRPGVQDFESNELMFRRFKKRINLEDPKWQEQKEVTEDLFSIENDSYIREKYSLTNLDVLYNTVKDNKDFKDWGVVGLLIREVKKIPERPLKTDDNKSHNISLRVIHDPDPCMYPHCELHIYDNGERVPSRPAKQIRTFIRRELTKKISDVIKNAD